MLVSQFIRRGIPELGPETLLAEIYPEDYPADIPYAPVLDEGKFIGFFDLAELENEMETNSEVKQCSLETVSVFLQEGQHIFEALPQFQKAGFSILPVCNEDGAVEGYLPQSAIAGILADSYAFHTEGGVIVLTVPAIQYSLSEISRLVEANQGKVLSVVLESDPVLNQNYLVHLKINQPDLSRIVATLERFEYNVLEVHQTLESSSLDKDRFDQLMRYLGI